MYQDYKNQLDQQSKQGNMSKGGQEQKKDDKKKPLSLEELFSQLTTKESGSLVKKYLTKELYGKLKDKKTKLGGTLAECIKSGALNPQSGVGLYACDPEAYTVFEELFDAVIKDYHKTDKINHPEPNFGDADSFATTIGDLDKEGGDMIVSTRVRVGRSHDNIAFPPCLNPEDRKKIEDDTKKAFDKLPESLKGTYNPLEGMKEDVEKQMIADHFLFKNDDSCLGDADGYKDWPKNRGIFFSKDKKFLVWINEEDHLRFISMQQGGNLAEVYGRLVTAIKSLETSGLKFAKKDGLGYLTFCPTNLGTTLRASVHIKIPCIGAKENADQLKKFCAEHNLQPRGIHGEHTESVGGVYDISNKRRLGLTEFDAIKEMADGVKALIAKEKEMAAAAAKK